MKAHKQTVQLLLSSGADPNIGNPLHYAVQTLHLNFVKLLVDAGANVNAPFHTWPDSTPLILAAGNDGGHEVVKFLLHSGSDVDAKDYIGQTALYVASAKGFFETVEVLLSFGATVDAAMGIMINETPLIVASKSGHVDVVKQLLAFGANINAKDSAHNWTPLLWASYEGHILVIDQLLASGADIETRDRSGRTPLYCALEAGHFNTALQLLSRGSDLLAQNSKGRTALGIGMKKFTTQQELAELISSATNSHTTKTKGITTVHVAAREGHKEIFMWLLSTGGYLMQADNKGNTPLHWAADAREKEMVRVILDLGAEVNALNKTGRMPLHLAARYNTDEAVEVLKMLLSSGADVDAIDSDDGNTALHVASACGNLSGLNVLLSFGANPLTATFNGFTPLHYASVGEHLSIVTRLISIGVDLNAADNCGRTALHYMTGLKKWSFVIHLLELGADALVDDNLGKSSLSLILDAGEKAMDDINLVYALVHGLVPRGFFDDA